MGSLLFGIANLNEHCVVILVLCVASIVYTVRVCSVISLNHVEQCAVLIKIMD